MRCAVITCGLFEFMDDHEETKTKLKEEITHLRETHKVQSEKLSTAEKTLVKEKEHRETLDSENKFTLTQLDEWLKAEKATNDELKATIVELKEALKKSQVDVLSAGDEAFERAKEKVVCLHPGLAISDMDFFKVVRDGHLIDLEEVEKTPPPKPNPEDPTVEENVNIDAEKEDP